MQLTKWVFAPVWIWNVKVIHWSGSQSFNFNIFKLLFLNNPWADWSQISCGASSGWGTRFCSNGPSHMTKMATMSIYGKNLQKFSSLKSKGRWPWNLKCSIEYYQICSNDSSGLTLTYFMARSNLVPYVSCFVWEKVKTKDFSETIVVYDIKVGRCSQLNVYMKLYEYQLHWLVQITQIQYF